MDMTELQRSGGLRASVHLNAHRTLDAGVDMSAVAAQLGGEIASPLTASLERINRLATTGTIDRQSLNALRCEVESARRAGLIAQQLARLSDGHIRQTAESIDLVQLLRDCVLQRSREAQALGLEIRQSFRPAQVIADVSLLYGMLQALLDWSLPRAWGRVELALEVKPWPAHARLICHLPLLPLDEAADGSASPEVALDSMTWLLVRQTALSLGLPIKRAEQTGETTVTIEFPRTVHEQFEGATAIEIDEDFAFAPNSKPLAGSHVLVVAARREVRALIRDAIRPMGLMVDFTTSVDEAREFCRGGLPHAIVYEAALGGERFEALRSEIIDEVPQLAFIAIGEDGNSVAASLHDGRQQTRVGRDAILHSLPSALLFELSRALPS